MSSQGSSKGSSKGSDFMSRTGSSRGVYKRNGEVMAIPFPTQINEALLNENKPFSDNSTMKESYKDPNVKAALTKYDYNALRNRLPVHFKNEAKPYRRFCQARNVHTHDFFGNGIEAGFERFRTTSQNFYDYDTGALAVGESNQGIVSEKARIIHKAQLK